MSDANPFAPEREPSRRVSTSAIVAWILVVLSLAGGGVLYFRWMEERQLHRKQAQESQSRIEALGTAIAAEQALHRSNSVVIGNLKQQLSDLEKEKELVGQSARTLEEEMRGQLESRDVTISKLKGQLTVTIVDRVMFDSGEAVLKPDGAAVMQQIADFMAAHPELKIHVIGHTDNVPIRQTAHSRFASNWELSAARALAAVHYLTEKGGVDPRRVGAVAYGEFRPTADNATAEGRAKNRRIEVSILPTETPDPESLLKTGAAQPTNSAEIPAQGSESPR